MSDARQWLDEHFRTVMHDLPKTSGTFLDTLSDGLSPLITVRPLNNEERLWNKRPKLSCPYKKPYPRPPKEGV